MGSTALASAGRRGGGTRPASTAPEQGQAAVTASCGEEYSGQNSFMH